MTRICVVPSFGSTQNKERKSPTDEQLEKINHKTYVILSDQNRRRTHHHPVKLQFMLSVLEMSYLDLCTGLRVLLF